MVLLLSHCSFSGSQSHCHCLAKPKSIVGLLLGFFLSCYFFISSLVETNRTPFDLPEAEAELVSGYNVEYSSFGYALFI